MIGFGLAVAPVGRPLLVDVLPDLVEANRRLEPVGNHKGHGDVGYDVPGEDSIKVHLVWVGNRAVVFQPIHDPQSYVGDQEEGDKLTTWLSSNLERRIMQSVT